MAANKPKNSARRRYWLFKSEPSSYSIDDLQSDGKTCWNGVRNYQARNLLRDQVKRGDGVLFYHSNAKPLAVVGLAKVLRAGYVDASALDPDSRYFDSNSDPDDPPWRMVDIGFVTKLEQPVSRDSMKSEPSLSEMMLLQRGARLSVQPVTSREWDRILKMAGIKPWC